jgi:branched-chain amino acid transport system permease protein
MTEPVAAKRKLLVRPVSAQRLAEPAGWAIFVLAALWLIFLGSTFDQYIGGLAVIYAISALGLDWIQGRAGQVSIGNAAFMAVGAYATATAVKWHVPTLAALLIACAAGAVVGLIFGLPALRLQHLYLALSTLALQFIVQSASLQYETSTQNYAGFSVPAPSIGPLVLSGRSLIFALVIVLALTVILQRNLFRRAPGRAWMAIRENQMAAAVIGIDVTRWKLSAFTASSALISLSGGLLAYYTLRVFDDTYTLAFALTFVAMVIVGGLGSIAGAIIGATLITIAPYVLSSWTNDLPSTVPFASWLSSNISYIDNGLYGVILLLFLLYQPRGIAGALAAGGRSIAARLGPPAQDGRAAAGAQAAPAVAADVTSRSSVTVSPDQTMAGQDHPRDEAPQVLVVRDLKLVYRTGAQALSGVDIEVDAGEIVAILGRNGAGKTSTLRSVSGFFRTDRARVSGSVMFDGREIGGASPIVTSGRGVVLVQERDKVFPSLTVAEHFRLIRCSAEARAEAEETFPPLQTRASSPAGLLSGGERQMLALALAWSMQPRLLLVDELSLGLAPGVTKRLISSLREYRDRTRVPILLVEQNVAAALDVADRIYIMEAGRVVHSSDAGEVSRDTVLSLSFGQR